MKNLSKFLRTTAVVFVAIIAAVVLIQFFQDQREKKAANRKHDTYLEELIDTYAAARVFYVNAKLDDFKNANLEEVEAAIGVAAKAYIDATALSKYAWVRLERAEDELIKELLENRYLKKMIRQFLESVKSGTLTTTQKHIETHIAGVAQNPKMQEILKEQAQKVLKREVDYNEPFELKDYMIFPTLLELEDEGYIKAAFGSKEMDPNESSVLYYFPLIMLDTD